MLRQNSIYGRNMTILAERSCPVVAVHVASFGGRKILLQRRMCVPQSHECTLVEMGRVLCWDLLQLWMVLWPQYNADIPLSLVFRWTIHQIIITRCKWTVLYTLERRGEGRITSARGKHGQPHSQHEESRRDPEKFGPSLAHAHLDIAGNT